MYKSEKLYKSGAGRNPEQKIVLVKMVRDPVYGEPCTADVHPDEVANWQEHGWVIEE